MLNVHERVLPVSAAEIGPLLDHLGGPDDVLWPAPAWVPLVLDGPVAVGAAGGHGPIRYRITRHEPGRLVEFTFDPKTGLDGTHTFLVEPLGSSRAVLRHVMTGRFRGWARLLWPLAIRWLHDALLEDLMDNAETAVGGGAVRPVRWTDAETAMGGGGAVRPARWTPWVRLIRQFGRPHARAVAVPSTVLLAHALPRVDWADAYAVQTRRGMPADPEEWADAIFRDPPRWVAAVLGLREALVGLVGIARGGPSSFDTVARAVDEVLLGTDERHLDFRASVLREPDRVVVTTVVRLHGPRGRAYSALVRRVHPMIVPAMLARAAHRLSLPARNRIEPAQCFRTGPGTASSPLNAPEPGRELHQAR